MTGPLQNCFAYLDVLTEIATVMVFHEFGNYADTKNDLRLEVDMEVEVTNRKITRNWARDSVRPLFKSIDEFLGNHASGIAGLMVYYIWNWIFGFKFQDSIVRKLCVVKILTVLNTSLNEYWFGVS